MKNFNLTTVVKISGAMIALFYLTACSSNIAGGGFGAANLSSTSTTTVQNAVATCSKDMSNNSDFQIHVEAAFDQFGTMQAGYARVAIMASPSDWTTSNYDLQFFRWAAVTNGSQVSTNVDVSPLTMQFERSYGANYYTLLADGNGSAPAYTVLNSTEIIAYAAAVGISATAPQTMLNQAHFLVNLRDSTGAYQVVRAVLRDKTSGAVVRQADALIPTFYANPSVYAAQTNAAGQLSHPAVLQALHPLQAYMGQGWTDSQYQSFMNGFCF